MKCAAMFFLGFAVGIQSCFHRVGNEGSDLSGVRLAFGANFNTGHISLHIRQGLL